MEETVAPVIPATATPERDRVPASQKLGYGLGIFIDVWGHWHYPNFASVVFNIFLKVNPVLVGIAVILNRAFDAVSDPVFGWLSDNTRTRLGRRRPYLLVGSFLAGLGLPLVVAVTPGWGSTRIFGHNVSNYFWFMLGSSVVYLPMVSCFNMPYQSLGYELTPDYHERTSVFSYQVLMKKIPELGLFFGGQFLSMAAWVGATPRNLGSRLVLLFSTRAAWGPAPEGAKPNVLLGAQVFCVLCGLIMLAAGLACFALVRERYYSKVVERRQSRVSIRETLWQTLKCRPFRILVAMNLAFSLGLSMVATLGLYDTLYYVCRGDLSSGLRWNFWMGVSGMIMGASGVPAYAAMARRLGKRRAMGAVFGCGIAAFLACWWLYTPPAPILQVFASGFIAFINAGYWTIASSMTADVVDQDELESGRRREGSFAACNSWITKVGMALGAGASFGILGWVGFQAGLEGHQSGHTLFMIRLLLSAIPIAGLVVALLALGRFPLSQEAAAVIRAKLEARRGAV